MHLAPMLVQMSSRGPDSAGVAVYRDPAPSGSSKLTLYSADPRERWDALADELRSAFGACESPSVRASHAVLVVEDEADEVEAWVCAQRPDLRVMSAGRVIEIYKEQPEVADLPDELEGVPVESVTTGRLEPRDHAPTHRFPRPVPIGVSAGLSGVATGTIGARVTDGNDVYALSNNHVFAGINSANVGDPIISPGNVDGGSDPGDRIGTLAAYQTISFNSGTNTMDAAIALTSTANVGRRSARVSSSRASLRSGKGRCRRWATSR